LRVKLDENLPRGVIGVLADAGHDADTVVGEGLGGATDDAVLARPARRSARRARLYEVAHESSVVTSDATARKWT
jgi:hypothetical protein